MTNLYTKKQKNLQKVKSIFLAIYWELAVCPTVSRYVRLWAKNTSEFLTFQDEDFFDVSEAADFSSSKIIVSLGNTEIFY